MWPLRGIKMKNLNPETIITKSVLSIILIGVLAVELSFGGKTSTVQGRTSEQIKTNSDVKIISQNKTGLEVVDHNNDSMKTNNTAQKKPAPEDVQNKDTKVKPKVKISVQKAIKPKYKGKKIAYLTFDDGPSNITPNLLDILQQKNVKATFFVAALSKDTPQKRQWIKRESDEGHTVGIHSWTHNYKYIYSSENNYKDDFEKMRKMIVSATGKEPKFVRFPGGTDNTVSLKNGSPIIPKLLQDVLDEGYIVVDWNAGGMDARNPIPSKDSLVKQITRQCSKLKTAVILLHDSSPHESSVEAVPEIIDNLRAMGFTFEPLTNDDQIVRHKPAVRYVAK